MAYQQHPAGHPVQEREWSSNLCNCSPCSSCLLATCLPCLILGKTSERIRDPTGQSHDLMNSDCLLFTAINCFTGLGCLYSMMKRGEIRERYGIKGSGFGDYCTSYWCLCCALIQQDNEVVAQNARAGYGPNTQGYQAQKEGMHMPAPGAAPGAHAQPPQYGHTQQQQQQYPVQSPPAGHDQGYAFQPQSPPPVVGHDQITQQHGVVGSPGSPGAQGYPHGKQ